MKPRLSPPGTPDGRPGLSMFWCQVAQAAKEPTAPGCTERAASLFQQDGGKATMLQKEIDQLPRPMPLEEVKRIGPRLCAGSSI